MQRPPADRVLPASIRPTSAEVGARALPGAAAAATRRVGPLDEPVEKRPGVFAALRHRDFALLWSAIIAMSAGQWLQQITLNWLVFEETGSAFLLGLINGCRMLPFLATSLISGVLADRFDRRRLLLGTQAYLFVTTLAMALLLLSGRVQVWHYFAFTLLSGVGWSFTGPLQQTLVPQLVPRADLLRAISLTSAAFNFTRMLGPALGGLLLLTAGGPGNFLIQAACYAAVLWPISRIRVPPAVTPAATAGDSIWQSTAAGLRYVAAQPLLRTVLLLALVPMTLGLVTYLGLLPIFAEDVYGIGAGGLGVLMAVSGLGSLVATLGMAYVGELRRKGRVLLGALLVTGLAMIGFGGVPWLGAAILFLIVAGGAQMLYMTLTMTILQTETADEMRGRVTSLFMLNNGLVPAFSFGAGALAGVIGAPLTVTLLGALISVIGVAALVRLGDLRRF